MDKSKIIGGLAGIVLLGYACSTPVAPTATPTLTPIPKAAAPTATIATKPAATATPTPRRAVEHVKYIIESGDNLWAIYQRCCNIAPEGYEKVGFNNFVQALKIIKRNGITDPALIAEGKELYIHVAQIRSDMIEGMRKRYGVEWISIEEINAGSPQIRSGTIIDRPINMYRVPRNNIERIIGHETMKNYQHNKSLSRSFSYTTHARRS